jgi:hypothetical protein
MLLLFLLLAQILKFSLTMVGHLQEMLILLLLKQQILLLQDF